MSVRNLQSGDFQAKRARSSYWGSEDPSIDPHFALWLKHSQTETHDRSISGPTQAYTCSTWDTSIIKGILQRTLNTHARLPSTPEISPSRLTTIINEAPLASEKGSWKEICEKNLGELNDIHLSCAIHSFAKKWEKLKENQKVKVYRENEETIGKIKQKILENIGRFGAQGLANVAWACAKLGIKDRALFDKISEQAIDKIKKFNPQNLSNLAWAFAKLNFEDKPLFVEIKAQTLLQIKYFTPQDIATLAWACAKLDFKDKPLLAAIRRQALIKIKRFNSQELSNLAWSCVNLNFDDKRHFFVAIREQARDKIKDFQAQDLAILAWACAKLQLEEKSLFAAISVQALMIIKDLNPQNLANLAWAFATFRIDDELLFAAIREQAVIKLKDFTSQNFANLAWAFATLRFNDKLLFAAIREHLQTQDKIKDFKAKDLAVLTWTFALFSPKDSILPFLFTVLNAQVEDLSSGELNQVYHAFYRYDRLDSADTYPELKRTMDESLKGLKEKRNVMVSQRQQHVFEVLAGLKHKPVMEQFELGFFIDIVLPDKVAVEVNGEHHYLESGKLEGSFHLKELILEDAGWFVVKVRVETWSEFTTPAQREAYLITALKRQRTR